MNSPKPLIMFMCIANSVRSQMAEGVARHYFSDQAEFVSCGQYSSRIHPGVVEDLSSIGYDASRHASNGIEEFDLEKIDVLISLVQGQERPESLPDSKKFISWPHGTPDSPFPEERAKEFVSLRESIQKKLSDYFSS